MVVLQFEQTISTAFGPISFAENPSEHAADLAPSRPVREIFTAPVFRHFGHLRSIENLISSISSICHRERQWQPRAAERRSFWQRWRASEGTEKPLDNMRGVHAFGGFLAGHRGRTGCSFAGKPLPLNESSTTSQA